MLDVAAAAIFFTAWATVPGKYADAPECAMGHKISSADHNTHQRLTECADDQNRHWLEARRDGKLVKMVFRNTSEAKTLIKIWHVNDIVK